jgi:hypothetical protein
MTSNRVLELENRVRRPLERRGYRLEQLRNTSGKYWVKDKKDKIVNIATGERLALPVPIAGIPMLADDFHRATHHVVASIATLEEIAIFATTFSQRRPSR